jgi:hypothetical protein
MLWIAANLAVNWWLVYYCILFSLLRNTMQKLIVVTTVELTCYCLGWVGEFKYNFGIYLCKMKGNGINETSREATCLCQLAS